MSEGTQRRICEFIDSTGSIMFSFQSVMINQRIRLTMRMPDANRDIHPAIAVGYRREAASSCRHAITTGEDGSRRPNLGAGVSVAACKAID